MRNIFRKRWICNKSFLVGSLIPRVMSYCVKDQNFFVSYKKNPIFSATVRRRATNCDVGNNGFKEKAAVALVLRNKLNSNSLFQAKNGFEIEMP